MPIKPTVLKQRQVARTHPFQIEQLDCQFSGGVERTYERLASSDFGSVAIVPVTVEGNVILVQEYGAGVDSYRWGVPKGAIDWGETRLLAANRELQEGEGLGAHSLVYLKNIHPSPSYMERSIDILCATNLYRAELTGDEPEAMATMEWPLHQIAELQLRDDLSDAISIAALFIVKNYLNKSIT